MGRWPALAAALILAGAAVLQFEPGDAKTDPLGALLMVAACACWALDNNLTQRLTLRDPFALVRIKTLVSGAVGVLLGAGCWANPCPRPNPLPRRWRWAA